MGNAAITAYFLVRQNWKCCTVTTCWLIGQNGKYCSHSLFSCWSGWEMLHCYTLLADWKGWEMLHCYNLLADWKGWELLLCHSVRSDKDKMERQVLAFVSYNLGKGIRKERNGKGIRQEKNRNTNGCSVTTCWLMGCNTSDSCCFATGLIMETKNQRCAKEIVHDYFLPCQQIPTFCRREECCCTCVSVMEPKPSAFVPPPVP